MAETQETQHPPLALRSVLVSYGYSNTWPPGHGLKTTQTYPVTVLEARGSRAVFLLEALGETLSPCLFQLLEEPAFWDSGPLPPASEPQA